MDDLLSRAREISEFLGLPVQAAIQRLQLGFLHNHAEVAVDFRRVSPKTDEELLNYYLNTEAYIWELSTYHLDAGFNYKGFSDGVCEKLVAENKPDVLVLGDGIGDLTMALKDAGLNPTYHDLRGSKTAEYAHFRHFLKYGEDYPCSLWTDGWNAEFGTQRWDCVCAMDFMEHLPEPEVAKWSAAVVQSLRPGGYFAAQNAFNCGSGEQGSIPMHLASNDHYEHDWLPLMTDLGMTQVADIWWQKVQHV